MPKAVRRSIIAALLLIVAVAVYGLTQLDGSTSNASTQIVQSVSPANNAQALQRDPVEIDLETGWDAKLTIDERPIPDDQLDRVTQQGKITFTPGPGKAFEIFPAGRNCVTMTYWQVRTGPEQSFVYPSWCFTVL
jgi:hypothetical protein